MANILKDGKTYTDVRGVAYSNPYMTIDSSYSQALPIPSVTFTVNIYNDSDSRVAGYQPVTSASITMSTADIVAYLQSPQSANSTEKPLDFVKKYIYIYLGTVEPEIPGVVWSDWKSDDPSGVPQTIFSKNES